MLARKHPSARCPRCGDPLYYGCKREPTGWKVQYSCPPPEGCGREFSVGRIARGPSDCTGGIATSIEDDVHERAEALGDVFK